MSVEAAAGVVSARHTGSTDRGVGCSSTGHGGHLGGVAHRPHAETGAHSTGFRSAALLCGKDVQC